MGHGPGNQALCRRDPRPRLLQGRFREGRGGGVVHSRASLALHIIRVKFQSLPVKIRTARLHTWITANLRTLPMADEVQQEERLVYPPSVWGVAKSLTDGTMRREDLQLASKIAAGQLSASKAIRYLFDSFFAMQSKIDRGLVRTKRTADEEPASELLFMLGHGAGVGDLLQNFGVLMPPQTTLHFQSELVPKPFLAFRRQARCGKRPTGNFSFYNAEAPGALSSPSTKATGGRHGSRSAGSSRPRRSRWRSWVGATMTTRTRISRCSFRATCGDCRLLPSRE